MKSLRDEIRTDVRDKEDGFNFIVSEANDFIRASRGFHRGAPQGPRNELAEFWGKGQCRDFTIESFTFFEYNIEKGSTNRDLQRRIKF